MEASTRRIVLALTAALGLALLTIAFLLGRITAKPAAAPIATVPVESPRATSPAPTSPSLPTTVSDLPPSEAEPPTSPVTGPLESRNLGASQSQPATVVGPTESPTRTPPGASQISKYFAEVERLEDLGGGDPQAFANSMMPALSSGDFSGFDELLAKAQSQRQRLLSIAPPSQCAEYHRLALALSADSVTMLERLKAALMKGDSMTLVAIASDGRTLEAQAARLKVMGEKIKRQAGV